jgi:molybdate transport system ATP-binding protein
MLTLDFTLRQGTFAIDVHERLTARAVALSGPSGSGKTTLLEAIAGLRRPSEGRIAVGEHVVFSSKDRIDLPAHQRRVGYVPQEAALFPHLDVRRNILYGVGRTRAPRLRSAQAGERAPIALARVLSVLELESVFDRRVAGLSGGERQRVALARALMSSPDLLLLDEPLVGLEQPLRWRVLDYIVRVRDEIALPLVYVTHQPDEARAVTDEILLLDAGRVSRGAAS